MDGLDEGGKMVGGNRVLLDKGRDDFGGQTNEVFGHKNPVLKAVSGKGK